MLGDLTFGVDIRDDVPVDVRDFFNHSTRHFDIVYHCAAAIPDAATRASTPLTVADNFALDASYFQWLMEARPRQAVYFSSSAAYPLCLNVPGRSHTEADIDLDDIVQPDSMYGLTKLVGEVQAREVQRAGQHLLVLRPQSGYGADQSENYPFRALLERVKRREDPLVVWGTGTQSRDFIHVEDVVGAVTTMLDANCQGPVNLGTGKPTSMRQLARILADAAGYEPEIVCDDTKPDGAAFRFASVDLMHDSYTHRISLEQGAAMSLEGGL
jgi:nucleoside-diphosphate-sugar epimerase